MTIAETKMNAADVQNKLALVQKEANAIRVVDSETYEQAAQYLIAVKDKMKWVETYWADEIKKAHELHKGLVRKREDMLDMLKPLVLALDQQMTTWRREEERRRKEEELKAQAEAKRIQEEQALNDAAVLEESGRPEEAAAVLDRASVPPPVQVPSSVPKTSGLGFSKTAKYRMINPALVKPEFLMPDGVKIGGVVRRMGKDAEKLIGGIEVYYEEHSVRRGG